MAATATKKRIKNTTKHPIIVNLDRHDSDKLVKRTVVFVPSNVMVDEKLGEGVVSVDADIWAKIKGDSRLVEA